MQASREDRLAALERATAVRQRIGKYHNRRVERNGIWFRSMLELNYAKELELRRHAEDPNERVDWWCYEVTFYLPTIRPRKYVRHVVDFLIGMAEPSGAFCLVECKGLETPTGKTKRLWLETYLEQPIRVVERV